MQSASLLFFNFHFAICNYDKEAAKSLNGKRSCILHNFVLYLLKKGGEDEGSYIISNEKTSGYRGY